MAVSVIARYPLGLAYAATQVNATIFRVGALVSAPTRQFVTYYDADCRVVVADRAIGGGAWQLTTLAARGKVGDAHNSAVLGISSDGLLHLAYDHHNEPLHYRVSLRPGDASAFGPERPMT